MRFSRKVQNLVAEFRGLPRDCSVSFLRDEMSIGNLFQNILKKYTSTREVQVSSAIVDNWAAIVGQPFGGMCTPCKISPDGALIIKVGNSIIRQELAFRKIEILENINRMCPGNRISNVVFSL